MEINLKRGIDDTPPSQPALSATGHSLSNMSREDCFKQCIEDSWELKSEFVCAEACGTAQTG